MKWRAIFLGALFLPTLGRGLEVQPWFSDVYEFHFLGSYAYSRFRSVQGGVPELTRPFNSNVIYAGLEFCPAPEWSVDGDIQVADTTDMPFNFRSLACQLRYLWFDDIVGDPVSFATGGNIRFTSDAAIHDISCPSHSNVDLELNFALGREFDYSEIWQWRFWCYGALGQANLGSPWVRAIASIETIIDEKHKWDFYALGNNGYGRHSHVNTEHFNGYAKIRQKSIDVGVRYGYRMGVWGTLRMEYARRVLSKACPQNVNAFAISYLLPFSF